jgi:hypothetical protein
VGTIDLLSQYCLGRLSFSIVTAGDSKHLSQESHEVVTIIIALSVAMAEVSALASDREHVERLRTASLEGFHSSVTCQEEATTVYRGNLGNDASIRQPPISSIGAQKTNEPASTNCDEDGVGRWSTNLIQLFMVAV